MRYHYTPQRVCPRELTFEVKNNRLYNVRFVSGCPGNLVGIGRLVDGMEVDEVIAKLEGIHCGNRPTSCPDQLAKALREYKAGLL